MGTPTSIALRLPVVNMIRVQEAIYGDGHGAHAPPLVPADQDVQLLAVPGGGVLTAPEVPTVALRQDITDFELEHGELATEARPLLGKRGGGERRAGVEAVEAEADHVVRKGAEAVIAACSAYTALLLAAREPLVVRGNGWVGHLTISIGRDDRSVNWRRIGVRSVKWLRTIFWGPVNFY